MPSDLKKKKQQQKRAKAQAKDNKKKATDDDSASENGISNGVGERLTNGASHIDDEDDLVASQLGDLDLAADFRSVTGVLASHPDSRDVHINQLTLTFHGAELLVETTLELNCGRRYGLIGENGCGKSNLLSALSSREIPVPDHIDIYHVKREMPPSNKTALQCVMEVERERVRLEREAEELALKETDEASDLLQDIYARLEEMDAATAEPRAAEILVGLGFTTSMQNSPVKSFSGGWRMRLALARALFIKPNMLLLDEPTNHLDLEACVWLEKYLQSYGRILVVISHSQDFMNGICTNIIHMTNKRLKLFGGNYDSFIQTKMELSESQMKRYRWEQDQIAHMKEYIARFGHGSAKLARQAQSKEKTLKKMVDGGLTEKVTMDRSVTFFFPDCGKIPPPVISVQNVSFKYGDSKPNIYKNLEFGVDLDSRIALVGPNGAGKSTLLKLIAGELAPTDGIVRIHSHLRMGRYHQHLQEQLDLSYSAVDWMLKEYPDVRERDVMRRNIGKYGLSGQQQTCPMKNLSDGQRCRVIFAWLAGRAPHLLLLDEPTNHLDMETIDALAYAINNFDGGLLLVSHDFRLISQVAEEIWICENQTVTKWEGTIFDYKEDIIKKLDKEEKRRSKQKAIKI